MNETKGSPYLIPLSIIVAGFFVAAGIFFSGKDIGAIKSNTGETPKENVSLRPVDKETDVIRGKGNPEIFVIEFSDFQCPYCKGFHKTMKEVLSNYPSVGWVYRHLPLTQIHPEAEPAALASQCVAKLAGNDAFWVFADGLFESQANLGETLYVDLAKRAGISESDFRTCLASPEVRVKISSDIKEAIDLGSRGTPSSFIVNKKGEILQTISGALPFEQVKPIIEKALQ